MFFLLHDRLKLARQWRLAECMEKREAWLLHICVLVLFRGRNTCISAVPTLQIKREQLSLIRQWSPWC
jgi:hypothetical protein